MGSTIIVSNDANGSNEYYQKILQEVRQQIQQVMKLADNNFEIFDAYYELDAKFKKEYTWCPYSQILPVIGADFEHLSLSG